MNPKEAKINLSGRKETSLQGIWKVINSKNIKKYVCAYICIYSEFHYLCNSFFKKKQEFVGKT
jgi:hypothetical protein